MGNKKAMISTFTKGDNYGQRLQNLALQTLLEDIGYETWTYDQPQNKAIIRTIRHYFRHPLRAVAEKCRRRIFDEFNQKFIRLYKTNSNIKMEDIYEKTLKDQFDLYVAGSDQIWNPYSPDVNTSHFLPFVPGNKKMAFAASFSVNEIPNDKKEMYSDYLSFFQDNRISVREAQGAIIIKNLIGIDVPVILDPTMMFDADYWHTYSNSPKYPVPSKYVLIYILGKTNLNLVKESFPESQIIDIVNDIKFFSNTGPQEFLWLIENADRVITDSYHCMIFSLLFQKSFKIINRESNGFSMKSRFDTLCNKFNIPEREITLTESSDYQIPYAAFFKRLNLERENVNNFIKLAEI